MKPHLRSFQLAEPGAGAGPWPLLPRAGGDRDACAAVCPGQRLVSSPLLDVTWPPPLHLSSPGSHGQRGSSIPGSVSWGSGGPRAGAGKGDAECRDSVWQPERWCFPCQQAALLPPAAPPSPPPQVLPAHWSTPFPPQHPWQMPLPTSHPSLSFGDEDVQCSSCYHWSLQLLTPSLLPLESPSPSCPPALCGITVALLCG